MDIALIAVGGVLFLVFSFLELVVMFELGKPKTYIGGMWLPGQEHDDFLEKVANWLLIGVGAGAVMAFVGIAFRFHWLGWG